MAVVAQVVGKTMLRELLEQAAEARMLLVQMVLAAVQVLLLQILMVVQVLLLLDIDFSR
jgi:hypothetical protein